MNGALAEVERTASEIEAYLALHPNAADGAEGIAAWWLEPGASSRQVVEEALELLVQRRVISATRRSDDTVIYAKLKQECALDG